MEHFQQRFLTALLSNVGKSYAGKHYILAISGGCDSMVLLELFRHLLPATRLHIAHFNHRIRGKQATQDEHFVRRVARLKGIYFYVGYGAGRDLSEEALRKERYEFLRKIRKKVGADIIVTAHHADDQLETFLIRLIRGSGLDGLKAMAPRTGRVLRPLLAVSRKEILAFARSKTILFRKDATNEEDRYLRNRVRKHLVPQLKRLAEEFGGESKFLSRFRGTVDEIRWVSEELRTLTKTLYSTTAHETPFWIRMPGVKFLAWPGQWQARVLRLVFDRLGAPTLARRKCQEILSELPKKRSISAPGKIQTIRASGQIFFQNEAQRRLYNKPLHFDVRSNQIRCKQLGIALKVDPLLLRDHVCRFFRPGDNFDGKKLKYYFAKHKIPKPERRLVPLLAKHNSQKVSWVFPNKKRGISVRNSGFPFSF